MQNYITILTIILARAVYIVQLILYSLHNWCKSWQLNLSVHKCGSFLLKGSSSFLDEQELLIENEHLVVFDKMKDLGGTVDSHLTFSSHIDGIISKGNQRILEFLTFLISLSLHFFFV